MNLILFSSVEETAQLGPSDARLSHVRDVLKMTAGDRFFVGVANGPRGKATILDDSQKEGMSLSVEWEAEEPTCFPVTLVVGLPRPQTARKVLQECTTLGVERICFFQSEKGERSYRESKLWSTDEWRRHLWQGAEQAFSTTMPEVIHTPSLEEALKGIETTDSPDALWALDIYEAGQSFPAAIEALRGQLKRAVIAIGSERGWSAEEREVLRRRGYGLVHLGERVLRTETACVLSIGIVNAALGFKPFLNDPK